MLKRNEPSEVDKAWSAGIIEGEGTMHYGPSGRPKGKHYAYIGIVMADKAVLDKISRLYGGGVYVQKSTTEKGYKGKKVLYRWAVSATHAQAVCKLILPYIVGEKRQAVVDIAKSYYKRILNKGQIPLIGVKDGKGI